MLFAVVAVALVAILVFWLREPGEPPADDRDTAADDADYVAQMRDQHADDSPEPSPAVEPPPLMPVEHEPVSYGSVNGSDFVGYLARPKDVETPLPALVIHHEWWGLNDNIKSMADQLAAHGYVVLATDFYDGQVYETPENAGNAMNAALNDKARLAANIYAAYDFAKSTGASSIGTLGWCFGGSMAFQNVLLVPEGLAAAVIYYGHVGGNVEQLEPIQSPVLAFFGGQDPSIPLESVQRFREHMQSLGKPVNVHVYDDAGHAFANPSGKNYRKEAAEDAWARTLAFLGEHMKPAEPESTEAAPAPVSDDGAE